MDALPLIEAHEVVLSTNDTYILMSCLEELETDAQKVLCSKFELTTNAQILVFFGSHTEFSCVFSNTKSSERLVNLFLPKRHFLRYCVFLQGKLKNDKMDVEKDAALEEKLKIIRLSLARNLSRAIVLEGNETVLSQNIALNGVPV